MYVTPYEVFYYIIIINVTLCNTVIMTSVMTIILYMSEYITNAMIIMKCFQIGELNYIEALGS